MPPLPDSSTPIKAENRAERAETSALSPHQAEQRRRRDFPAHDSAGAPPGFGPGGPSVSRDPQEEDDRLHRDRLHRELPSLRELDAPPISPAKENRHGWGNKMGDLLDKIGIVGDFVYFQQHSTDRRPRVLLDGKKIMIPPDPTCLAIIRAGLSGERPVSRLPTSPHLPPGQRILPPPVSFSRAPPSWGARPVRAPAPPTPLSTRIVSEDVHLELGNDWRAFMTSKVLRGALSQLCGVTAPSMKFRRFVVQGPGKDHGSFWNDHSHPKSIGTIVVFLPSQHEGGQMSFTRGRRKWCKDVALGSGDMFTSLAWCRDVKHHVQAVTSGYRLALVYDLWGKYKPPSDAEVEDQERRLRDTIGSSAAVDGEYIMFPLSQTYTGSEQYTKSKEHGRAALSQEDMAMVDRLSAVMEATGCMLLAGETGRKTWEGGCPQPYRVAPSST